MCLGGHKNKNKNKKTKLELASVFKGVSKEKYLGQPD